MGGHDAVEYALAAANVIIKPSSKMNSHPAGTPFTVAIPAGQIWAGATTWNLGELIGTDIQSDNPVGVVVSTNFANNWGGGAFDTDANQPSPVADWGTNFIVAPPAKYSKAQIRIVPSQNGTTFKVIGGGIASSPITLNLGTSYMAEINSAAEIMVSCGSIELAEIMEGDGACNDGTLGDSDSNLFFVPPSSGFEQSFRSFAKGGYNNYTTVVVPTTSIGCATLDGLAIPSSGFTAVGSSGYSFANVALPPTDKDHAYNLCSGGYALIYGYGNYESYGHLAGRTFNADPATGQITSVIPGTLTQPGSWIVGTNNCFTVLGTIGMTVNWTITGANPSSGSGIIESAYGLQVCYTGLHAGTDTFTVIGTQQCQATKSIQATWVIPPPTLTYTLTFTPTASPSATPSFTPTPTPSTTCTATPTMSPTFTPVPTLTPMTCCPDGSVWTVATAGAAFSPRYNAGLVVYHGMMWMTGSGDVWNSYDGIHWSPVTATPAFNPTLAGILVVHDPVVDGLGSRLWLLGGGTSKVWSSFDGITWNLVTAAAPYGAVTGSTCLDFGGNLWMLGGSVGGVRNNNVWYSKDGLTWTQVSSSNLFTARSGHASVVYGSPAAMYVIAGTAASGTVINDVWSSQDGVTWNTVNSNPPFAPRYGFAAAVDCGRIWVMGGVGASNGHTPPFYFDTWTSADGGLTWGPGGAIPNTSAGGNQTAGAFGVAAVSYNNTVWLLGGDNFNSISAGVTNALCPAGSSTPAGVAAALANSRFDSKTPMAFARRKGPLATFPNPGQDRVLASFHLDSPGSVVLALADISGKQVRRWPQGIMDSGEHDAWLDTSNLSSGLYFLSLQLDPGSGLSLQALFKVAIVR